MVASAVYSVERRVGRLVEARLFTPREVAQVAAFAEELRGVFAKVRGKSVIVADWRAANLLAPDVADALVNLLRRGNPHLERSALLLSADHALFNLQVERVVREAANPARRTFRDPVALRAWTAEVLTAPERERTEQFLADHPVVQPSPPPARAV